jgi:hypothetical protein
MAPSRIAKGTKSAKASGTLLELVGVSLDNSSALVVGVAYVTGQGEPTVKWGSNRTLRRVSGLPVQSGMECGIWVLSRIRYADTRPVKAIWDAAIGAKAMFVTELRNAHLKNVGQFNTQVATTDPATGTAVTTTAGDTIHIAAFGSKGPSSDVAGTAGVGHTLGQRAGTVGAPPVSNVTIQETYEILSETGNCRATMTGATERDWANCIVAFKDDTASRRGISPGDLAAAEYEFEQAGLDPVNACFRWNPGEDRYEVFNVSAANRGAVIKHQDEWEVP